MQERVNVAAERDVWQHAAGGQQRLSVSRWRTGRARRAASNVAPTRPSLAPHALSVHLAAAAAAAAGGDGDDDGSHPT